MGEIQPTSLTLSLPLAINPRSTEHFLLVFTILYKASAVWFAIPEQLHGVFKFLRLMRGLFLLRWKSYKKSILNYRTQTKTAQIYQQSFYEFAKWFFFYIDRMFLIIYCILVISCYCTVLDYIIYLYHFKKQNILTIIYHL